MTNQEKIQAIQAVIDHPGTERTYYGLLEDLGDLKGNYTDYMTTEPINCNEELQRVKNADYELCTALLTAILREDHFSNGSFERRHRAGQVDEAILQKGKVIYGEERKFTRTYEMDVQISYRLRTKV